LTCNLSFWEAHHADPQRIRQNRRQRDGRMVFREEGLRHLVAEMGAGQIVYGTDMPFPWPAPVDFILNAKFLSDAEKSAILGGTLVKALRINVERT